MLKVPGELHMNEPTAADVTVLHPNDTGFELNQVTVMYIPPHFVRSISVSYAQRKVFDADLDFSVSENPTLRFNFVPHGAASCAPRLPTRKTRTSSARWPLDERARLPRCQLLGEAE